MISTTFHRLQDLRLTDAEMEAETLGTAKVYEFDDAIRHEHDVGSLDVPATRRH